MATDLQLAGRVEEYETNRLRQLREELEALPARRAEAEARFDRAGVEQIEARAVELPGLIRDARGRSSLALLDRLRLELASARSSAEAAEALRPKRLRLVERAEGELSEARRALAAVEGAVAEAVEAVARIGAQIEETEGELRALAAGSEGA